MARHQPKELTELAFASFTEYMKNKAPQFLNWTDDSPTSIHEATKTCGKLKDFFHGTRLPPVLANEITIRLLRKLDFFSEKYKYTREDYFQQILMPLVEVFMHPDVTSIELGPGYLNGTFYCYCQFIVALILKNVYSLRNLKTLSVRLSFSIHLKRVTLVFPSQLKELTLCGTMFNCNDNLKSISECCRELKSFKIFGCSIFHISVPAILKLNRLETLHLLQGPRLIRNKLGKDSRVALINGISTDTTSDVLSASTLKSFGIFLSEESSLRLIVDKLPHLTEIILQLENEFDLSCLTQLKNLRSLTLDTGHRASDGYKKILPILSKNLVFLELRGYRSLDFEFIGETCSNLRCLHICTHDILDSFGTRPKPSLKTFPNLRTVECLRVDMFQDYDWIEFLITQCVNIKVLSVVSASDPMIIVNILNRTSLTNLEEIHWYPPLRIDKSCLEELCLKCPNLRLVHGLGSDSFTSERVVFYYRGFDKRLCKSCNWFHLAYEIMQ